MNYDDINRVVGGQASRVVVGNALYTLDGNLRGFAITCRITGTIIAAINVQDEGGNSRSYVPNWVGVSLVAGVDYFVSEFPIVSIQLTGAGDSITLHCDRPY